MDGGRRYVYPFRNNWYQLTMRITEITTTDTPNNSAFESDVTDSDATSSESSDDDDDSTDKTVKTLGKDLGEEPQLCRELEVTQSISSIRLFFITIGPARYVCGLEMDYTDGTKVTAGYGSHDYRTVQLGTSGFAGFIVAANPRGVTALGLLSHTLSLDALWIRSPEASALKRQVVAYPSRPTNIRLTFDVSYSQPSP